MVEEVGIAEVVRFRGLDAFHGEICRRSPAQFTVFRSFHAAIVNVRLIAELQRLFSVGAEYK